MKNKDSNIALYRKYRPNSFDEVIGQDHIVKALSGGLKIGNVSHAYLLCGPRGIGKTTIARIIAKELGTSVNDIYEMDAASNRGIDDIREIRESVSTLPFDSKYKVYILDEVHMFSKDAWNALLKTIEEPPEHVVFILATTELEKVPETIISRCQTFILKKPTDAILVKVINNIAQKEGYTIADGGAELIALLADGAFRDALSNLQKIISFSKNKKISLEEIEEVTGAPNDIIINSFLDALVNKDIEMGYLAISKASSQNIDMTIYLKMILMKLRYALMLRYSPRSKNFISEFLSEKDIKYLEDLNSKKPEFISSRTLSILLEAYQAMRYSAILQLPIEIALVKILNKED